MSHKKTPKLKSMSTMTQISYSQVRAQVNQSLKQYTSAMLAFYASHATQGTQMLSIKGLFSHLKLQTNPEARALSWGLSHSNKGGPKLVHYYYTTVFILCALHINTTLNSNSWLVELPFLGPMHVTIITPCLVLTQSSGSGPDPGLSVAWHWLATLFTRTDIA